MKGPTEHTPTPGDSEARSPLQVIRESLADSVASHGVTPLESLKAVIQSIRNGDWAAFEREPMKRRLMALQAVLIDEYWKVEVTSWREQHSPVGGLGFPRGADSTQGVSRALTPTEWEELKSYSERDQRRQLAMRLQLATMFEALNQFERRIKTEKGAVIFGGRDIHAEFLRQSSQETALGRTLGQEQWLSCLPRNYFTSVVGSGLEVGTTTAWLIDAKVSREIAATVASSHLGTFPLFRTAVNSLRQIDCERVRSTQELSEAILKATRDPNTAHQIAADFLQERMLENTSYDAETTGCSSLYTAAFFGLIDWVAELKGTLG